MSYLRHTVLSIALATAAISSWAQTDAERAQHAQHQANVLATERLSAQPSDVTSAPGSVGKMAAMDSKMKTMHEMHEKMMNAKTPEERHALMAEHMKTMQECMAMMGMMSATGKGRMQGQKPMPGNMKQRQMMLEKRMEMMEGMMQMMMDSMPAPVANSGQ
jgi:hypothetical protein